MSCLQVFLTEVAACTSIAVEDHKLAPLNKAKGDCFVVEISVTLILCSGSARKVFQSLQLAKPWLKREIDQSSKDEGYSQGLQYYQTKLQKKGLRLLVFP